MQTNTRNSHNSSSSVAPSTISSPASKLMSVDPGKIGYLLATDCGSTTTKSILIQKIDGVYRQTHRGEAPTTVEAPFADVTIGVVNAITEIQELANRRLIDDQGRIIRPASENQGCDIYI